MSSDASLNVRLSPSRIPEPNVRELNALATRGLVAMFDGDRQLFCHRLIRTERGLVRDGLSPRYTIMTLLGLRELEVAGGCSPFDTASIYKAFVRDTSWIHCVGDLGLLIWLIAAFSPDELRGRFPRGDLAAALDRYPDARAGRTTELSWFLSGLAQAAL